MASVLQSFGSDPLKASVLAEAALGLLASVWAHGDPTLAIALFGLVALESQQSLVPVFVLGNAFSIFLDIARLLVARHAFAYGLLFIVQIAAMLCKAYVSYQCYDLFGFSGTGGSAGPGDVVFIGGAYALRKCGTLLSAFDVRFVGSEYQAAAAGPRADPFRYEAPPQPPPPAQNLYSAQQSQSTEQGYQSNSDPAM